MQLIYFDILEPPQVVDKTLLSLCVWDKHIIILAPCFVKTKFFLTNQLSIGATPTLSFRQMDVPFKGVMTDIVWQPFVENTTNGFQQ